MHTCELCGVFTKNFKFCSQSCSQKTTRRAERLEEIRLSSWVNSLKTHKNIIYQPRYEEGAVL